MFRYLPLLLLFLSPVVSGKTCLFLASYHKGYEWQDGIEKGMRSVLVGKCNIEAFYLDTKRNTGEEYARSVAIAARKLIESMKPDVVIASDDSASRYVIAPYFKNAEIPFVFCGVNWSAESYGFPYDNVTGMLEIISIDPLLKAIRTILPDATKGVFIAGDVPSTRSNFERYRKVFAQRGIKVEDGMVMRFSDWKRQLSDAQENADFIILANKAGITGWDDAAARDEVLKHSAVLTVGHHEFMVKLNMLSMTKTPREQGEWAAKVAIEIMNGTRPSDIPIIANRRWNIYANETLLRKADIKLPDNILRKAVKVKP